jgi:predicted ester cyclase
MFRKGRFMDPQQLIRDSLEAFNARDEARAFKDFAPDIVITGFTPQPIGLEQFKAMNNANLMAFPDWHFDIKSIETQGDQVAVNIQASGTQNGDLDIPGMMSLPASGKKVSAPDRFICTVGPDMKLHRMDFDSPPGGGFGGILHQLGVDMSGV